MFISTKWEEIKLILSEVPSGQVKLSLSETSLADDIEDTLLYSLGYPFYRKDRIDYAGSKKMVNGLLCYIRSNEKRDHRLDLEMNFNGLELLCIEILTQHKKHYYF